MGGGCVGKQMCQLAHHVQPVAVAAVAGVAAPSAGVAAASAGAAVPVFAIVPGVALLAAGEEVAVVQFVAAAVEAEVPAAVEIAAPSAVVEFAAPSVVVGFAALVDAARWSARLMKTGSGLQWRRDRPA